ncbi:MAG: phosphoribosylanthranilate isomerase [Pseudomonadota bacterium]
MSITVKICGVSSRDDVAAVEAAGADAVGFVFTDSIRKVSPEQAAEASVDVGILKIAVMKHPSPELVQHVLEVFQPDIVQTDAADFAGLSIPDSIRRWPVYREGNAQLNPVGEYVYEGKSSGSGETVDWHRAAAIAERGQMILAGGLAEDNVGEAILTVRPVGIDVSSGVESLPGYKDYELIRRFVAAVRAAEKNL